MDLPSDGLTADDDPPEGHTSMLLRADTRPVAPEWPVQELKGIHSGLKYWMLEPWTSNYFLRREVQHDS